MPAPDRKHLLDESTQWARLLYSQDRVSFGKYMDMARRLDPDIAPSYPNYISLLSRYLGYENAEALATLCRKPKTLARKALQKLQLREKNPLFDWN